MKWNSLLASVLVLLACGESTGGDDGSGGSGSGSGGAAAGQGGAGAMAGSGAAGSAGTAGAGANSGGTSGAGAGSGGTASAGGSAGGAGNGGTSGSAGSGGACGCAPSDLQCAIQCANGGGGAGDCTSDKQCDGGACVELSPGGYRVCAPGPIEATSCTDPDPLPFPNECCQSSECEEGLCVNGPGPEYCGGPAVQPYNYCASDECESSADCSAVEFGVCFPAGAYGFRVATCRAGGCRVDADCTEQADGRCLLVLDECCGAPSLACVYADGCRTLSDCPDGSQSCHVEEGRTVCSSTPALCPL